MKPLLLSFEKAAHWVVPYGGVRRVGVNEFDVLAPTDTDTLLFTENANVCTGIALVSTQAKPMAALMHVYSGGEYIKHGKDAIFAHAEKAWDRLASVMEPGQKFQGVIFGAQKFSDNPLNMHEIVRYLEQKVSPSEEARIDQQVSQWMSEALYKSVENSGLVSKFDDLRFENGPHNAVIHRSSGTIAVAETRDDLLERLAGMPQSDKPARPIFPTRGLG